ncbi:hypothetical protein Scep_028072 [Stephania cephalantha]|uniref:Uncharacterized protein n=1 Tax=Stephania cephalantha TaxID=152367 RepID=A0AAP0E950_9MAGN
MVSHIPKSGNSIAQVLANKVILALVHEMPIYGPHQRKEEKLPNIDDDHNPLEVSPYIDDIYYWVIEVDKKSAHFFGVTITDEQAQLGIIIRVTSASQSIFKDLDGIHTMLAKELV